MADTLRTGHSGGCACLCSGSSCSCCRSSSGSGIAAVHHGQRSSRARGQNAQAIGTAIVIVAMIKRVVNGERDGYRQSDGVIELSVVVRSSSSSPCCCCGRRLIGGRRGGSVDGHKGNTYTEGMHREKRSQHTGTDGSSEQKEQCSLQSSHIPRACLYVKPIYQYTCVCALHTRVKTQRSC